MSMMAASSSPNPRRIPAHLSVSLRHGRPISSSSSSNHSRSRKDARKAASARKESDGSGSSGGPGGMTAQKWFNDSNNRPEKGMQKNLDDNESPFFLPRNSSAESSRENLYEHLHIPALRAHMHNAMTNGSSDDYRSVIDDLTIENKKLKDKLRKYESHHDAQLESDKLFEVKIHGLAPKKRKELKEMLRTFASNLHDSDENTSSGSKEASKGSDRNDSTIGSGSGPGNLTGSSGSRPVDSAYASMSVSGPTSVSDARRSSSARAKPRPRPVETEKIESFLHEIPEGLLPKSAVILDEREKKKLVVRRLEQLFTGKVKAMGDHSQPLQQQEVSKRAARADQPANNPFKLVEGHREAQMLPQKTGGTTSMPSKLTQDLSSDVSDQNSTSNVLKGMLPSIQPEQRPTRPLDLDPDRAQVPSENVEYIRHLGLSTPQLASDDSGDAECDDRGWIYLNLLVSLAQLHIINVTPDFVRSAIEEVSSRFQLSADGRQIRWRGGSKGTRFSSDSDTSSAKTHSPQNSDGLNEPSKKRRKVDNAPSHKVTQGTFLSVPREQGKSAKTSLNANAFHYQPLFNHQTSEDDAMSINDDASNVSCTPRHPDTRRLSRPFRSRGRSFQSETSTKPREDGPIVFYNGANFCTDLARDHDNIPIPIHETATNNDGYSGHSCDALGCSRSDAAALERTASGSRLPYRPFKQECIASGGLIEEDMTNDTMADDDSLLKIENGSRISSSRSPTSGLATFDASGLGGTQPADHFAITVQCKRTKLNRSGSTRPPENVRNLDHIILRDLDEHIMPKLATLRATKSPTPPRHQEADEIQAQGSVTSVKTEIISTHFQELEPSHLPDPSPYYSNLEASDSDSQSGSGDESSSYSSFSRFRRPQAPPQPQGFRQRESTEEDDEDDAMNDAEEDEEDEEIDMLAAAREIDPETIKAREREFEIEDDRRMMEELPARSSVATVDAQSGSEYSSSSEDDDDDD